MSEKKYLKKIKSNSAISKSQTEIEFDEEKISEEEIKKIIKSLGYKTI